MSTFDNKLDLLMPLLNILLGAIFISHISHFFKTLPFPAASSIILALAMFI